MTKLVTFDSIYPVNSIYLTIDKNFNPNITFGGNWELLPQGKCLQTSKERGGELVEPGLPNIKGRSGWACHPKTEYIGSPSYGEYMSGAFVRGYGYNKKLTWGSGSTDYDNLDFDASGYNPIYGASETVQPPAYTVFAWLRIG